VVDCAEPEVRWCILPHYRFTMAAIRIFGGRDDAFGEIGLLMYVPDANALGDQRP
jgi:hypothetical protein